jgi:hypothetical protein
VSSVPFNELLYHGTHALFQEIDLAKSAPGKDFGRGFYTTGSIEQAVKFAKIKAARESTLQGYVYVYQFVQKQDLRTKVYTSTNEEWFEFVLDNRGFKRSGRQADSTFDIIIGPVANDAVGTVLNNYIDGVYGDVADLAAKDTAMRLLLTQRLHDQVFFRTQRAVDCLEYLETKDVHLG